MYILLNSIHHICKLLFCSGHSFLTSHILFHFEITLCIYGLQQINDTFKTLLLKRISKKVTDVYIIGSFKTWKQSKKSFMTDLWCNL